MTTIDRSYSALATGVLALWMGLTDAMLKYLRPSMRPWVISAGVGLVVLGVYGVVRARYLDGVAQTRVGWLLVVPVVAIILFGPQPMGEFAVGRTPHLPEYAFDIAAYASSTDSRAPALKMLDVLEGVRQRGNREYLASHDVGLNGFVSYQRVAGAHSFVLTHFLISCCAADAQALSVTIVGVKAVPDKNQWLKVTARFEPTESGPSRGKFGPVLRLTSLDPIAAPSSPYETLR